MKKEILIPFLILLVWTTAEVASRFEANAYHKRSILVAKNSFEFGCVRSMLKQCGDRFKMDTDRGIINLGECYENYMDACKQMAVEYETFFTNGPK